MTGTLQGAARTESQQATERAVTLTVNGSQREAAGTLSDLLTSLSIDARSVVVERNGVILRDRASFGSIALADADVIEIVHFVGGG